MRNFAPCLAIVLCGTLAGCATPWRTAEPIRPTTYAPSGAATAASVGRLARLAVMTAALHREEGDAEKAAPEWRPRSEELRRGLQSEVVAFLVEHKGYEARPVDEEIPADERTMRETGARLGVDGIVTIERWVHKPWSTGQAIGNIFLLNVPLLRALNAVNLRISIHESASGRMVWMREMKGEMPERSPEQPNVREALGDLENAVPAQLRRKPAATAGAP